MKNKVEDLIRKRFGRLMVIERAQDYVSRKGQKARQWKCLCDCGNQAIVRAQYLRNGHTKSCGCLASEDLTGRKYGKLTVIKVDHVSAGGNKQYLCKCDCGNTNVADGGNLKRGLVKSCGCTRLRYIPKRITHGYSSTRLYHVWSGMKSRCFNKKNERYEDYDGRGITICPEWLYFENFRDWAYANGYDENAEWGECTIERKDVNGNYEPSNCEWITIQQQQLNKRAPNGKGIDR